MRRRRDDLPALGSPASAASTTSFRRRSSSSSSPGRPVSAKRGVCRVGVAKRALPRPPWPPRATTWRLSATVRSPMRRSFASMSCVPTGTRISASSPSAPCFLLPPPFPPRPALTFLILLKAERSRRLASTMTTTSPPRPPSPPSGPPFGTYFSRRKLSPPSPPRPASAWMCARSWNTEPNLYRRPGRGRGTLPTPRRRR